MTVRENKADNVENRGDIGLCGALMLRFIRYNPNQTPESRDRVFIDPSLVIAVIESERADGDKVAVLKYGGSNLEITVEDPDRSVAPRIAEAKARIMRMAVDTGIRIDGTAVPVRLTIEEAALLSGHKPTVSVGNGEASKVCGECGHCELATDDAPVMPYRCTRPGRPLWVESSCTACDGWRKRRSRKADGEMQPKPMPLGTIKPLDVPDESNNDKTPEETTSKK